MNHSKQGLTTQGMSGKHAMLILLAALIVGVSAYLTKHYFNIHFNNDLTSSGLCNISKFWNCDVTSLSSLGSIFNIPTSVFGLVFGVLLITGSIFASEEFECLNSFISKINLLFCLILFFYSLISLGGLCPVCFAYYVLSALVAFLFWKYGHNQLVFDLPRLMTSILIFGLISSIFAYQVTTKKQKIITQKKRIKEQLLPQYFSLKDMGKVPKSYGYFIHKSTENFDQAPIRITAFSDFQCPYCSKMSEYLHKFKDDYDGKINIDYMFFPLDSKCNDTVKGNFHPVACKAAYVAACSKDQFLKVHDDIFENQQSLNEQWLDEYSQKNNITECINNPETKKMVMDMIADAKKFNVKSTPTLLINGRRIDGLIRLDQFKIIFDELIERHKN